jgi:hypothetical protein
LTAGERQIALIAKSPSESALFGGYDPTTHALRLTVEAASVEDAQRRMAAVAPLVEIKGAGGLTVLAMASPSRKVPLFMQGFFEATRLGVMRPSRAVTHGVVQ